MTLPLPGRYEDRGTLGDGAMGEVRRVRDLRLGVDVAMKVLRADLCTREAVRSRFESEARLTARLRHPGIVAVHDLGRLADGRSWFTMQVVEGKTLREWVNQAHASRSEPVERSWETMLPWVADAADAVAYAHGQGVVHRDLKPSNIMLGAYGEVLVMDWGVAKGPDVDLGGLEGLAPSPSRHRTMAGRAVGTPPYMSPEQAWAAADRVGPWSDVYALGALLYKVLSGRSPYRGDPLDVLAQVKRGPPLPLREVCRFRVPEVLDELVAECMQREPERRPSGAEEVARRIRAWLDGERRRDVAVGFLAQAEARADELSERRARLLGAEARLELRKKEVPTWAALRLKRPIHDAEMEVRDARQELRRAERTYTQYLRAALFEVPDLPEARGRLADLYRTRAEAAVLARRDPEPAVAQLRLVDDGRHRGWVQGDAWITLVTFPAGARVEAFRIEDRAGLLEPIRVGTVGTTPLLRVALGTGSWMLEIRSAGGEAVLYPVFLARLQHLVVKRPGDAAPTPIPLPEAGELRADEVYVPAGWTQVGGGAVLDPFAPAKVWVDGFVAGRECVSAEDWAAFLTALRRARQATDPLMPRDWGHDDRTWPSGATAVRVSWEAASQYAAWRGERDGLPWRLLHEVEWEKLARGADGRRFPWGDREDEALVVAAEGAPPLREAASPFGVLGLVDQLEMMGNAWRRRGPTDGIALDLQLDGDAGRPAVRGGSPMVPYFQATARLVHGRGVSKSRFRLARSYP
jgi:serine/threonine-protein kinase